LTARCSADVLSETQKALAWVRIGEERSSLLLNFARGAQLVGSGGIDRVQLLSFESDSFDLGLWLRHQFPNGLKDNPKPGIVLLLQLIESSGKPLLGVDVRAITTSLWSSF